MQVERGSDYHPPTPAEALLCRERIGELSRGFRRRQKHFGVCARPLQDLAQSIGLPTPAPAYGGSAGQALQN
jgi:hypothetical protein